MRLQRRIHQCVTHVTSLRAQRIVFGIVMLAIALPTAATYEFWGTNIVAYTAALGGSVSLGLAWANPPKSDRRQVVLGVAIMATFGLRFVVFAIESIRRNENLVDLYLGSSALWIHCAMFYVGCVVLRDWYQARHGRLG